MAAAGDTTLAAVLRVASRYGLVCDHPEVVRDLTNYLVHLSPAPVVARVQTVTARVRDPREVIARAVEVTTYLVDVGAPVAGPSTLLPPGPHLEDGLWVSFWEWHDHDAARLMDPASAGHLLGDVHEALVGFAGQVPSWDGIAEARTVLAGLADRESAALLAEAADDLAARVSELGLPQQVVHGDAHLANVLCTPTELLWTDWEITHVGPRAWDLGSLVIRSRVPPLRDGPAGEQALAGYGAADADVVDLYVAVYGLFQTAWWHAILEAHPHEHLAGGVAERMAWWRGRGPRAPARARH